MTATIPFEIKNRWTREVQVTAQIACSPDDPLALKLGLAVRWAVRNGANLRWADLRLADLQSADLQSADLRWADLRSANLQLANLRSADLRSADLRSANLRSADLRSANLRSANLRSAENVDAMVMPDGLTFSDYKRDVVPALLTAGGKTMAEIKASGCWGCHSWTNCPMHVAFGVNTTSEMVGPLAIFRARAEEFIQFFDAKLIPAPWDTTEPPAAVARAV